MKKNSNGIYQATKAEFDTWRCTQPRKIRHSLKESEKIILKDWKSSLEETIVELHPQLNEIYSRQLQNLYNLANLAKSPNED